MAELEIVGEDLVLRLSVFEKIAALRGDLRLPTSSIGTIDVATKPFGLVRGFRAAGLSIPRRVAIGTFRRMGSTRFIVLKGSKKPAVHITFTFGKIAGLVVGTDQAEALAQRLRTEAGL